MVVSPAALSNRERIRIGSDSIASMVTVETREEVVGRLEREAGRLLSLGVRRLRLFGSFARQEPSRESDVDLLVDFASGSKTFDNFMGLAEFLEEVLNRRVELVTTDSLSSYLRPSILAEARDVSLVV
jgi:predicted nucleotidyltransferase